MQEGSKGQTCCMLYVVVGNDVIQELSIVQCTSQLGVRIRVVYFKHTELLTL
jgi:hypothetical protein